MVHAWFMHGSCMVHAWFMHGSCMVHAWFMHGSCMVHAWFMHGSCMVHAWFMHDAFIGSLNENDSMHGRKLALTEVNKEHKVSYRLTSTVYT